MLLFPDVGTNVAARRRRAGARREAASTAATSSSRARSRASGWRPCPLEPRSAAAEVGADGRLTAWLSTQTPHQDRLVLAGMFGLDPAQIRVVAPDVGGGFGAKMLSVEEILVVWLARRLGRPVRWTETRSESMVALNHGRGQELTFTIGADRDGKVAAFRLEILAERRRVPGPRRLPAEPDRPDVERRLRVPGDRELESGVRHEHDPDRSVPRRRAGPRRRRRSSGRWTSLAVELGLDPAEIRRRNFIPKDAFPYTTASHAPYDSGDYEGALDLALALGRLRRAARRSSGSGASRAARSSSGSGSAPTSRSRTGSTRRSSARSRSRPTAARSSAPARSRTARATRRRSR